MRVYVITNGIGGVEHVATDEGAARAWAEEKQSSHGTTDVEWRQERTGVDRLYYRDSYTGRWNKIPAMFVSSAELEAES